MTHLRQLKCFESRPAANFVPDQGCEAGGLNLLWQPGSLAVSGMQAAASPQGSPQDAWQALPSRPHSSTTTGKI